ncbi:MAG TPA: transcriptional regulator [Deltaproteobacteria bacterium]|nr:transcriptional regulator [Deltaproteobacteria bacterium]HOM28615.1 transcriptional regulator [Deltaproteobacteria bacterium]HPP81087.1 transcriptional regulator [Deltaproteobacteria bacterium]
MKMLLMVYDAEFDDEVMAALARLPLAGYTKWDRVLGKGRRSEPKLDDAVWPGFNCAVAVAVDDETEEAAFRELQGLFTRLGGKGFSVFELPVLKVI